MTCTTLHTRKASAATTLHDFVIQGAAEHGQCSGAQSFRATHRPSGSPVLLHKFRPATSLTALGPVVADAEPPDFTKPFVTRFTHLFTVAGSAYLVEPLPPCSSLSDVWRHVLQKRPHQTLPIMAVLIQQLISITRGLVREGRCHGALNLPNVVLAPAGCFGVLTAHLECEKGMLWLRKDPQNPPRSDTRCLVDILCCLLDLDAEVARAQGTPTRVPMDIHSRIRRLVCNTQRARRFSVRHTQS